VITTPRCGRPVAYRAANDTGTGSPAKCGRPAGHEGDHHLSRAAYERELEHKRDLDRAQRGKRGARELKPCGTEAAYRRHIRHGEVPDEDCRIAGNQAADRYRKARLAA